MAEGRYDGQRYSRRDNGFLVETPVAEPNTVVESEHGVLARAPETVGVLNVAFHSRGFESVVGSQAVYHVQVVACMRYAVSCRVPHLVLR